MIGGDVDMGGERWDFEMRIEIEVGFSYLQGRGGATGFLDREG